MVQVRISAWHQESLLQFEPAKSQPSLIHEMHWQHVQKRENLYDEDNDDPRQEDVSPAKPGSHHTFVCVLAYHQKSKILHFVSGGATAYIKTLGGEPMS